MVNHHVCAHMLSSTRYVQYQACVIRGWNCCSMRSLQKLSLVSLRLVLWVSCVCPSRCQSVLYNPLASLHSATRLCARDLLICIACARCVAVFQLLRLFDPVVARALPRNTLQHLYSNRVTICYAFTLSRKRNYNHIKRSQHISEYESISLGTGKLMRAIERNIM